MNDIIAQRLIAAIESNTVAHQSLQHSLEAVLAKDSKDNRMVNAVQLGKALGLDSKTVWRRMVSGEYPSEGEGRNRRANIAVIKELRKQEGLVAEFKGGY